MSKTYAQIAYEVGAAWLLKHKGATFRPWEKVTEEERAYWDEICRVISKTVYEHHFGGSPKDEPDECNTCGELDGGHRSGCPNSGAT